MKPTLIYLCVFIICKEYVVIQGYLFGGLENLDAFKVDKEKNGKVAFSLSFFIFLGALQDIRKLKFTKSSLKNLSSLYFWGPF